MLAFETGNAERAEKLFRESIRLLTPMRERGTLCESQRYLAQLLLAAAGSRKRRSTRSPVARP